MVKINKGRIKRSREDNPLLTMLMRILILVLIGLITLAVLVTLRIVTL